MLREDPLHDGDGIMVVVVLEMQQQTVGRCHDSVFDVRMEASFVLEFDVVDSLRWVSRYLFGRPVNIFACLTATSAFTFPAISVILLIVVILTTVTPYRYS